jgi:hypothetical protein
MKKISIQDIKLEAHNIIYAVTNIDQLEEDRIIFAEHNAGDKHNWVIIEGSHCSCYGFDDLEWTVIAYTRDELLLLADVEYNQNDPVWQFIKKDEF